MSTKHRLIDSFRKVNLNAGCDPVIVDICLAYIRYCYARGISLDFSTIHPSVDEILEASELSDEQRKYLCTLREHFWRSNQIPDNLAHLNLWYCYNLLRNQSVILFSSSDLAGRLNLSNSALHYIASDSFPGYTEFEVTKSGGGTREISAPVPKLRWVQRWILDNILSGIELRDCATAYVEGKSILDNAFPHTGAKIVVNLDLKSFFPSISFRRIMGVYLQIGYVYPVAVVLAKLSCHQGKLPQGAPTSPAISNLVCRRLDSRLLGLARSMGFEYTRYADDITFSGDRRPEGLVYAAERIIKEEGFVQAKHKTHMVRRGRSQRVTGLVVNSKVNVPRCYYRRIRAIIHNCQRFGVESQNRNDLPFFKEHLYGHAHFIHSINHKLGERLLDQLKQVNWNS